MGLLDFASTPEGMQGLALLAAAAPTMEPTNLAGRLAAAGNTYRGLLDNDLKGKLTQAQIDNFASEAATRKAALDKQQKLLDLFSPKSYAVAAPAAMGQLGSGSFGIVAPPAGQPAIPPMQAGTPTSLLGSMTPDQLAQAKLLGVDLTDVYKLARPDIQVSNGYAYDKNNVRPGFLPQLNVANNGQVTQVQIGQDGQPVVAAPRGSLEAYSAFRNADEAAKAGSDLVKVWNPQTQREEFRPRSQVLAGSQPSPMPSPRMAPVSPMIDDADRVGILRQEMSAAQQRLAQIQSDPRTTPDILRRAQTDVIELTKQLAPYGGRQSVSPGPSIAAGPSTAEAASKDATLKINDSWLKTSYEPTLAAGNTARDLSDTVNVTRQAMQNLGGTGWGTQAKAAGAAVLSGLGIAPKNAEMFAANAQVFQKTAMDRLWSTLNEAKGPQTEGDAQRAAKTYASLANTPQANAYILDLAQARADRDQIKARFYQQAMPLAREKGDLSEVDREWAKRSPSIFSMPSMKPWAGGVR